MNNIVDVKLVWNQGFANVVKPIVLIRDLTEEEIEEIVFDERNGQYVAQVGSTVESFYVDGDARGMDGRVIPVKLAKGGMQMLAGPWSVPPSVHFKELAVIESLITNVKDDFDNEEKLGNGFVLTDHIIRFIQERPLLNFTLGQVKRVRDNVMWLDFVHREMQGDTTYAYALKDYGAEEKHVLHRVLA